MTNPGTDDARTPVEVLRDFTEGWLTAAEGLVQQLTDLTAQGWAMADQRTEDLCRWGDDGGYTP